MAVEILISAKDFNTFKKGWPVVIKDSPAVWGSKEGLPQFIRLTITDASRQQVLNFLDQWPIEFDHKILAENDQGYRIQTIVDEQYVDISQTAKNKIKQEMRDFLIDEIGAQIVNWNSSQVTFDIAKPVDLQELKSKFADLFDDVFSQRRYYFSEADVDQAVSMGGELTLTKKQVLNKIIDRLTE